MTVTTQKGAARASPEVEKPKPAKDENGRFLTGNIGGGRKLGSRSKLAEAFIADCYENWLQHGAAAIEKVRQTRPAQYLQVMASILPKDVNVSVSAVEAMTDDELDATIRKLLTGPDMAELIDEVQRNQEFEGTC